MQRIFTCPDAAREHLGALLWPLCGVAGKRLAYAELVKAGRVREALASEKT